MNPAENLNDMYLTVVRSMPGERRLHISFELFDMALQLATAGIKSQYPTFTEEQVAAELRKRISADTRTVASARH